MAGSSSAPTSTDTAQLIVGKILPALVVLLGALIALGVTLEWGGCYVLNTNVFPVSGTDLTRGDGVFVAGLVIAAIGVGRAFWRLPDGIFALTGGVLAAGVLALVGRALTAIPDTCDREILGLQVVEVRHAAGLYLTIGSSAGAFAVCALQYLLSKRAA